MGPKVLDVPSALILSLGLAVSLCRLLSGKEKQFKTHLRHWIFLIPFLMVVVAISTMGFGLASEIWRASQILGN
jgi:hypothetical protein